LNISSDAEFKVNDIPLNNSLLSFSQTEDMEESNQYPNNCEVKSGKIQNSKIGRASQYNSKIQKDIYSNQQDNPNQNQNQNQSKEQERNG